MQEWLKKYNFNSCWKEVYAEWRLCAPERFKGLTRYVINIKIIKFFLFIKFVDYTLNNEQFELLLARILPHIQKKDSNYRRCFPPPKRLAIFLVFIASGSSYSKLSGEFGVGITTVHNIIKDVSVAVVECLQFYLKTPATEDEWMVIHE